MVSYHGCIHQFTPSSWLPIRRQARKPKHGDLLRYPGLKTYLGKRLHPGPPAIILPLHPTLFHDPTNVCGQRRYFPHWPYGLLDSRGYLPNESIYAIQPLFAASLLLSWARVSNSPVPDVFGAGEWLQKTTSTGLPFSIK